MEAKMDLLLLPESSQSEGDHQGDHVLKINQEVPSTSEREELERQENQQGVFAIKSISRDDRCTYDCPPHACP